MDVLSDLLFRAQAKDAQVRQLIHPPPWSMTYADAPPLALVAVLRGSAVVRFAGTGATTALHAGDVALIGRARRYTIADRADTPEQYVIRDGVKYLDGEGEVPAGHAGHAGPAGRTYGADSPDATVLLRGSYELSGDVAERLLEMLPRLAVLPAGRRTAGLLELLTGEARLSEPGQDAVLRRLLDRLLVIALREWCARGDVALPAWCRAPADPVIGDALHLLHEGPEHPWTVGGLASRLGLSRATFAERFTETVGEPPISCPTNWRMALAADQLRDSTATVAQVARSVGYQDPFAFSVAFKRTHHSTPSRWRRASRTADATA